MSNKTFPNSTQSKMPNRFSSNQKRFTCNQCQKTFSRKGNLATHKITHSGEKPYHCDICQKKFAQSNNLTDHRRIHTGEKPFHCEFCKKKISSSTRFTKHQKGSHRRETLSLWLKFSQLIRRKKTHTAVRPHI